MIEMPVIVTISLKEIVLTKAGPEVVLYIQSKVEKDGRFYQSPAAEYRLKPEENIAFSATVERGNRTWVE